VRYLSFCSGIEAATVAWHSLGWTPAAFCEIDKFPSRVLAHHYPDVPNLGDFTKVDWTPYIGNVDICVGGTPCQAFSVAGLRNSLADERGNLTLEFVRAINIIRPHTVVWENVPGVLSTADNAFGCFLGALVGSDEPIVFEQGWPNAGVVDGPERRAAWRVLDAQYFGLAQRRKRVFVVANSGDQPHPAEILLEWEGLRRDSPPSRTAGEGVAGTVAARTKGGGGLGTDFECTGGTVAMCLQGGGRIDAESETLVSMTSPTLGKESFSPAKSSSGQMIDFCIAVAPTLRAGGNVTGGDRPPGTDVDTCETLVAIPLDLRNATRDPDKHDEQNRQGCGVGAVGEPAPTLTKEFVPGVAVGIHGNVAHTLNAHQAGSVQEDGTGHGVPIVTHPLRAEGHDASEGGTGRRVPLVPVAWDEEINAHEDISGPIIRSGDGGRHAGVLTFSCKDRGADAGQLAPALRSMGHDGSHANGGGQVAVSYSIKGDETRKIGIESVGALRRDQGGEGDCVVRGMAVRRLTPVECERLQGFRDNYTNIPGAADGPRYKALGNSMAVPCMAWIGRRIKEAYAND